MAPFIMDQSIAACSSASSRFCPWIREKGGQEPAVPQNVTVVDQIPKWIFLQDKTVHTAPNGISYTVSISDHCSHLENIPNGQAGSLSVHFIVNPLKSSFPPLNDLYCCFIKNIIHTYSSQVTIIPVKGKKIAQTTAN